MINFVGDFAFWNEQLLFFRFFSQRNPGLTECHKTIVGLKHILREEQKRYRKLYGEFFTMRTVDARILIDWVRGSGYKANPWELSFMSSVYEQGFQPTAKQKECLQRIYEKSAGGGVYIEKEKI